MDLELRVAGPVVRAAALAIDTLLRAALYLALTPLLAFSGVGIGLALLGFFLEWFYPVFAELRSGATLAAAAMGLAVVHDDGTPVGSCGLADPKPPAGGGLPLPMFYAAGLVSYLLDRDFRRLGDLAAGTLVVHVEPPLKPQSIPERPPIALPLHLDLATQQAVLAFAERSLRDCPSGTPGGAGGC